MITEHRLSISYYANRFWYLLRNSIVVAFASIVVLIIAAVLRPDLWGSLFTVIIAWVVSDFIVNIFIHGGQGISQTFWSEARTEAKGHAYLAFFLGIVVATYLSSGISAWLLQASLSIFDKISPSTTNSTITVLGYAAKQNWLMTCVAFSSLAAVLVFADLNWRFYKRSSS